MIFIQNEKYKELLIEFCKFIDKKENIDTENETIQYILDGKIDSVDKTLCYQPIGVYKNNKIIHFFMIGFNKNHEIELLVKHINKSNDVNDFVNIHLTKEWTKFLRKKKLQKLKNENN